MMMDVMDVLYVICTVYMYSICTTNPAIIQYPFFGGRECDIPARIPSRRKGGASGVGKGRYDDICAWVALPCGANEQSCSDLGG